MARGSKAISASCGWISPSGRSECSFAEGKSLRIGDLVIEARDGQASFEVDLERPESPVVAGPTEAVASIEVGGVKLWPK